MDVNNAQFKIFFKKSDKGNAFNMFARPQAYTICVLVRNTKSKQSLFVYDNVNHSLSTSKYNN